METQSHVDNTKSTSWSSATNWTVSNGSLDTSITFESFDSPAHSETLDSTPKPPLILKSPSTDSGPCEIKITFTQKHEIRQVYVRSTARVYEIYYAPALQSSNEYLCTVRCGIAARDEELVHATAIEGTVSEHSKRSNGGLAEEKFTSESNIGTNEDDWVEVKIPHSSPLDKGNSSFPKKTSASTRNIEDVYEATAEITDADPCMSLTLRLLSLQNKGCVCVDEVYVFGDPLESADSENQTVQVGNSAGSSLMAMLAPTLLQLSKSGVGRLQDKHTSSAMEKQEDPEIGSRTSDLTSIANGSVLKDEKPNIVDGQDVKLKEVSGTTAEPAQSQNPIQISGREKNYSSVKNDLPYSHVERVLEQLVSRVSRIEDICLRFEENLLKPINSMDARLQRVEQQLEVIAKNSHNSGLPSYTRFSAPAFSSIESNSSSFYNEGGDFPPQGASELEKDTPTNKISKSSDDTSTSVIAPQFLPSLVVTAPEFSCGDDEEENDALETSKDFPQEKPKKAFSIDDALAAALAGFSSMTLRDTFTVSAPEFTPEENGDDELPKYTQLPIMTAPEYTGEESGNNEPSKYTQTLKVTAPEFLSEENGNDDKLAASPSIQNSKLDENEFRDGSVSTSSSTSVDAAKGADKIANDALFEETSEGVNGQATRDFTEDGHQITEETSEGETSNRTSKVSISEENAIVKQFLGNQTDTTTQEGVEEKSEGDAFPALPKSPYASAVDFEIPILDVTFVSRKNSIAKSPLEALFACEAGTNDEAPRVQECDDGAVVSNLNDNQLLVDLESDDVGEEASDIAGGGVDDNLTCINQEMFASLI